MPSLQQGKFIEAAVQSVFQAYETDVELIVTDGGSTDDTLTLLDKLSLMYPGRLIWTSQPDDGPASAVNRAVKIARAPILGWLNSDDLYQPGAIRRALAHFERNPNDVLVYGEGDFVDNTGSRVGVYPTLPPATPISELSNGCFICQPTVFLRKEIFESAGGLDESLLASFDFDLWVRLLKKYPGRIGFVHEMQASTRLHEGTITAGQRARVALEGIQITARHLGHAPPHWVRTYFVEAASEHPFHQRLGRSLFEICDEVVKKAESWLSDEDVGALREVLGNDRSVEFSTPWFYASVHPDGWAPPDLSLKVLQPDDPIVGIELHCGRPPNLPPMLLTVSIPGEDSYCILVEESGRFDLHIEVKDTAPGARVVIKVACDSWFVPAEMPGGGEDSRALCFLVEGVDIKTLAGG